MTDATRSPAFARPLRRLRLRLTLLTAGVFMLILGGLGAGIYIAVRHEMSRQLDASLRHATAALEQAAGIREMERARATVPAAAPPWITRGPAERDFTTPEHRAVRLHAERFTSAGGTPYVAVAAADRQELEDRFAALLRVFVTAALAAVLLVAAGGWVLVRQST